MGISNEFPSVHSWHVRRRAMSDEAPELHSACSRRDKNHTGGNHGTFRAHFHNDSPCQL